MIFLLNRDHVLDQDRCGLERGQRPTSYETYYKWMRAASFLYGPICPTKQNDMRINILAGPTKSLLVFFFNWNRGKYPLFSVGKSENTWTQVSSCYDSSIIDKADQREYNWTEREAWARDKEPCYLSQLFRLFQSHCFSSPGLLILANKSPILA